MINRHELSIRVPELAPQLYRYFCSRLSPRLADEAVQETFLRMLESKKFSAELGSLISFMWGIAENVQLEMMRKDVLVLELRHETEAPADQMGSRSEFADLRRAITQLERDEQKVMQLVLADLAIKEIAQITGFPEGTVKSHMHRGRENLRKIMLEWGYK